MKFWSKFGQIPFIELNGEQIADSNIIIQTLQRRFDKGDNDLTPEQEGVARAFMMMLENQTVFSCSYFRFVEAGNNFYKMWEFLNEEDRQKYEREYPKIFKERMEHHGIAKHEVSDIYDFGCKDFQAVSDFLGKKRFIFGENMTTLDCYLFAHIAQIFYIPIDYPHKPFIKDRCANLLDYVVRIKEKIWPDWEEVCANNLHDRFLNVP